MNVHCFCNTEKTLFFMSSMNRVYLQIDKHEKSVLQIIQWIITVFDNGNRFYPKAHNTEKSRFDSVLCIFNDYSLLFQWFFSVIDNGNRFYPKLHNTEKSRSDSVLHWKISVTYNTVNNHCLFFMIISLNIHCNKKNIECSLFL